MAEPLRILLKLFSGWGFGDVCQGSILLQYLRHFRPAWSIDCISTRGAHSALHGLCNRSWYPGEPGFDESSYDRVMDLALSNHYQRFDDRPSNKTYWLLPLSFGLTDYLPELGRYKVDVGGAARGRVRSFLNSLQLPMEGPKFKAVVLHYKGSSSVASKDLSHDHAQQVVHAIRNAGRTPILLDWQCRSELPPGLTVSVPDTVWGGFGHGDAETIAAMIGLCEAFVGIDSGPGKIASSTDTPSLICWRRHHPLMYHDPAPNTTHLIREDWEQDHPCDGEEGPADFFRRHYAFQKHRSDHELIAGILHWLRDSSVLGSDGDAGITFIIPPDPELARWCVAKMRGIACGRPIHVMVSGRRGDEEAETTALMLRDVPWIVQSGVYAYELHVAPERPVNTRGHVLYLPDGWRDGYFLMTPGTVRQVGGGLEDWLPDVPSQLDVWEEYVRKNPFVVPAPDQ